MNNTHINNKLKFGPTYSQFKPTSLPQELGQYNSFPNHNQQSTIIQSENAKSWVECPYLHIDDLSADDLPFVQDCIKEGQYNTAAEKLIKLLSTKVGIDFDRLKHSYLYYLKPNSPNNKIIVTIFYLQILEKNNLNFLYDCYQNSIDLQQLAREDPHLQLNIIELSLKAGMFTNALKLLGTLKNNNDPLIAARARTYRLACLFEFNYLSAAETEYTQLLEIFRQHQNKLPSLLSIEIISTLLKCISVKNYNSEIYNELIKRINDISLSSKHEYQLLFNQYKLEKDSNKKLQNLQQLLDLCNQRYTPNNALSRDILLSIASHYAELKEYNHAIINYKRIIDLAEEAGDTNTLTIANVYIDLAFAYHKLKNSETAHNYLQQANTILSQLPNSDANAYSHFKLNFLISTLAFSLKNYKLSNESLILCLNNLEQNPNPRQQIKVLLNMATNYTHLEDYVTAHKLLQEVENISKNIHNWAGSYGSLKLINRYLLLSEAQKDQRSTIKFSLQGYYKSIQLKHEQDKIYFLLKFSQNLIKHEHLDRLTEIVKKLYISVSKKEKQDGTNHLSLSYREMIENLQQINMLRNPNPGSELKI